MPSTLQPWVEALSRMQQSVLLAAIRGADGTPKFHKSKMLVRFLRRCLLVSAFDGKALNDPWHEGGGSFTGPSIGPKDLDGFGTWSRTSLEQRWGLMQRVVDDFMDSRDEMSLHYYTHFMHATEILGYKHPDSTLLAFWNAVYTRMAHALHLWPEGHQEMDKRLGDNETDWRARADESSSCSD